MTRVLRCGACKAGIADGEPVVFAMQDAGTGPLWGTDGWYVVAAHEECAADFIPDYSRRTCRGCERTMWVRGGRRTHCSDYCRHVDFKRRQTLAAEALAEGRVLYRDDLYHLTGPGKRNESRVTT